MHDRLFASQRELSPERYEALAKELGLDVARFRADVERQAGRARVEQDQALAAQIGAQGTPTSFVNCRKIVGALPFDAFRAIVEEEVQKADALAKSGVKGPALYERLCAENVRVLGAAAPGAPAAAAAPPPAPPVDAALVKRELRADDPARGRAGAPLTLVVFSDFQCPYCSRAVPTLKQIESAYRDDVRIVWKHQPLPFHQNAMPAAIAAEAARQQGKFWEMHDRLFQRQGDLTADTFERIAQELGLDLPRFRAALADPALRQRVQQDQALAARLGINGTPTFLVGAEKVTGALPFEAFKAVIDRQLGAARARN
jgi:protein-disulfide isomerase